jgi:hypothetical protein
MDDSIDALMDDHHLLSAFTVFDMGDEQTWPLLWSSTNPLPPAIDDAAAAVRLPTEYTCIAE